MDAAFSAHPVVFLEEGYGEIQCDLAVAKFKTIWTVVIKRENTVSYGWARKLSCPAMRSMLGKVL
jgi:hypothetical protein